MGMRASPWTGGVSLGRTGPGGKGQGAFPGVDPQAPPGDATRMTWQAEQYAVLEALVHERVARHNDAVARGLPDTAMPLAEGFIGTEHAPWLPPGTFRGLGGGVPVPWQVEGLLIVPRRPDEGVVAARVRLEATGPGVPATGALFLGTWVRRDGLWRLLRHRAELARLAEPEPTWAVRTRAEMSALVRRWIEEQTLLWQTGRLDPGSVSRRYTGSLVAEQYAEWHPAGGWRGDGAKWVASTVEEARQAGGHDWRWRIEGELLLPRSDDEAAVAYQIGLAHGTGADAPRSRGIFLETWVRRDGGWALHRHLGELAWS